MSELPTSKISRVSSRMAQVRDEDCRSPCSSPWPLAFFELLSAQQVTFLLLEIEAGREKRHTGVALFA